MAGGALDRLPLMDEPIRPFSTVTVFGGMTLDRIALSEFPPVMGASNPGTVRRLPGGVGFNVATVLTRLGFPTRMVSAVGDDSDADAILATAHEIGIGTDGVAIVHGASTAGYHATFDDAGNLIIGIADMKICELITPVTVSSAAASAAPDDLWVIDANLPQATIEFLAAEAAAARRPLAALTVSPAKAVRLASILDAITVLFTNRKEAAALLDYDPDDPKLASPSLALELTGARSTAVVVTSGSEPLAAARHGEVRSYAPLRAEVTGVNGAGDSLAAGTILGLSDGIGLGDAVRFGMAAAAMALEAGGILAAPFSRDALAERLTAGPRGQLRRAAAAAS